MTTRSYWAALGWLVVVLNPVRASADPADGSEYVIHRAPEYPYQEGWPLPPGYHVESRSRKGLVWSGAAVLGSFYVLPLLVASNNSAAPWLLVPIVGPGLFASHQACTSPCDDVGTPIVMMMFTAGQVAGAALLAAGVLAQKRWVVPNAPVTGADDRGSRFVLVPHVDRSSAALVVLGLF